MGKNLIPVIAKELGVEIGEEFEIQNGCGSKYRLNEDELQVNHESKWERSGLVINALGNIEIIKLPLKPVYGQRYYTFTDDWDITWIDCEDTFFDSMCKELNVTYRDKEEAIKARPAKYKELTGKDWSGDNG